MLLLSTVVAHHHHYERVCIAFEECSHELPIGTSDAADSAEALAREGHTHQESSSCRVHQLHEFIVSSGVVKNVRQHVADGHIFVAAVLPTTLLLPMTSATIVANWQHHATPLSLRASRTLVRRGPPVF